MSHAFSLVLVVCAFGGCQAYADAMLHSPSDVEESDPATGTSEPTDFSCRPEDRGAAPYTAPPPVSSVGAGDTSAESAMSEAASKAMRLHAQERFGEALPLLQRVVAGKTVDSVKTREQAQYRIGVGYYRLRELKSATEAFAAIAAAPLHREREAAGRFLLKLTEHVAVREQAIDSLVDFSPRQVIAAGEEGTALHDRASVVVGRALLRHGRTERAIQTLEAVNKNGPHAGVARECIDIASAALTLE